MTDATLPERARRALDHVAARSSGPPVDPELRVTLNFHPDRDDPPILAALATAGRYRSQFATGTGNGGLTARPGGDRWRWESRIFGGAYDDADPEDRPVYGALNFRHNPAGAAPRFGSAHFVLAAEAVGRATFCYPDSHLDPEDFGVAGALDLIATALADTEADALDDYIEAQVHGPVGLATDIEALVLDPCYRGTPVEELAHALPCPVRWHGGFRLTVDEMARHPDYRGPEFVLLAREIAPDGLLTPRVIGEAARTGKYDPQALKRVWHYVARFGAYQAL
ncbi:DUF3626 domain-containing protein [Catenulispora subtropica]|uniref:DUF3626 domain-containing protein n=1 Tax=Catenulispora subtropica TaxID=450798 RepID=A0ABP5E737_9ACTN